MSCEETINFGPFKKYECILNNKSETFENKVQSLIDVWKSIAELDLKQFDIRYVIQIIDWAKLHALNIVLTGEWRSMKEIYCNALLDNIDRAQSNLRTINDAFSTRCQKLAHVVKKPWEHPVLTHLLHTKEADIGSEEIEFFCVETAYLVSVRLKKLCENHCEDLALNLVTNFIACKKLSDRQNFSLNATETQMWFIFDIYIALLFKFQDKEKILQNFEDLKLEEGYQLVKRFAKKRVKISKIWRNCHKVAIFGSRFFLLRILMKYSESSEELMKELLENILKIYIFLSNTDILLQQFVSTVRTITSVADAAGLCVLCDIIHTEAGTKIRHFAIEMYIRALTTDMNELEKLKHLKEDDKVQFTTSRLARTFTNLADLLKEHVNVARECALTAFSLEPTKLRLQLISELAVQCGFPVLDTGQEWKCQLHPPVLPSDDIAWVCSVCGDWMCKPELNAPAMQTNTPLNEALQESVLGISEALCDDLAVCLSNPRYQVLSWLLPWTDLYRLCVMYLNNPEKTKNFVTELKYIDIDYSLFQHIKKEPIDEFTGIEKGYEQYLDLNFVSDEEEISSVSEDSSQDRALSLGSDGSGEPYSLPQPKSDPKTLKSLRMFRPSIKRKASGPESDIPEKHFKGDNEQASSPATISDTYSNSPCSLSEILGAQYSTGKTSATDPDSPVTNTSTSELSDCRSSESLESKNGIVATLPPLGGQVAVNSSNHPIQVQFQGIQSSTKRELVQLLQNRSLCNGIKENEKRSSDYNMNSNRDDLLSTKQIFAKMMALHKPGDNQEVNNQYLLNTELCHNNMQRLQSTVRVVLEKSRDGQQINSTTLNKELLSQGSDKKQHKEHIIVQQPVVCLHRHSQCQPDTAKELTQTRTTRGKNSHFKSDLEKSNSFAPIVNLQPTVIVSNILAKGNQMIPHTSLPLIPATNQPCTSKITKPKYADQITKVLKVSLTKLSEEQIQQLTSPKLKKRNSVQISNNQEESKQTVIEKPTPDPMEVGYQNISIPLQEEQPQSNTSTTVKNKIEVARTMLRKELMVCLTNHIVDQAQSNLIQQSYKLERNKDISDKSKTQLTVETRLKEKPDCKKIVHSETDTHHSPQNQSLPLLQMDQEEHLNSVDCSNQQVDQSKVIPNSQNQQVVKTLAQLAQQKYNTMNMEQTNYSTVKVPSCLTIVHKENPTQQICKTIQQPKQEPLIELSKQQIELSKITTSEKEIPPNNHVNQVDHMIEETLEMILEKDQKSDPSQQIKKLAKTILSECPSEKEIILAPPMEHTCKTDQEKQPEETTSCQQLQLATFHDKDPNYQLDCHKQKETLKFNLNEEVNQEMSLDSNQITQLPQTSTNKEPPASLLETVKSTTQETCLNLPEVKVQLPVCSSPTKELHQPDLVKQELLNPPSSWNQQTKTIQSLPIEQTSKINLELPKVEQVECSNLQVDSLAPVMNPTEPPVLPLVEVIQEHLEDHRVQMEIESCPQEMDVHKEMLSLKEDSLTPSHQQEQMILELPQENFLEHKVKVEEMEYSSQQMMTEVTTMVDIPISSVSIETQVKLEDPIIEQSKCPNQTMELIQMIKQESVDPLEQQTTEWQELILTNKEEQIQETECLNQTTELNQLTVEKQDPVDSQQQTTEAPQELIPNIKKEQTQETVSLDQPESDKNFFCKIDSVTNKTQEVPKTSVLLMQEEPHETLKKMDQIVCKEEPLPPLSCKQEYLMTPLPPTQEPSHVNVNNKVKQEESSNQEKESLNLTSCTPELSTIPREQITVSQNEVIPPAPKEEETSEETKVSTTVDCNQNGPQIVLQNSPECQIKIPSSISENTSNITTLVKHDTEVSVSMEIKTEEDECKSHEKKSNFVTENDNKENISISTDHKSIKVEDKEINEKVEIGNKVTSFEKPLESNSCIAQSLDHKEVMDSFEHLLELLNNNQKIAVAYKESPKDSPLKKSSIGYIDDEIFCDLTDYKSEEEFFNISTTNDDTFNFYQYMDDLKKHYNIEEAFSKNLKKYKNTHKIQHWNVPCFKIDYDNDLQHNKNSENTDSVCVTCKKVHLNVVNDYKLKDLRVMLQRIPTKKSIEDNNAKERRCRRTTKFVMCHCCASPKKRKSSSRPEKHFKKRKVYAKKTSPLLDKNKTDDETEESKKSGDESTSRKPIYVKKVFKHVPGLYDYDMLTPTNRNQIINVVQVSNSRSPSQNTQTSTQISPHIQRIGQPRVVEQKPESSEIDTETSTSVETPTTTTATTTKPTTSQPSTLINILSQQIIRPGQSATRRQGPMINILSQQIIRPGQQNHAVQKVPTTNAASTMEDSVQQQNNALKPESTTSEVVSQSQVDTTTKSVPSTTSKVSNTATSNQGGTILQFICKSSLPKFQQAFGKAVFTNSTSESTETTTSTTVETGTNTASNVEIKKIIPSKTVPVNVQPIQGNVIYRGQMPVGQTISLIPPGSTTRQLFRITGSTHEQISLVKETVIQNKMSALLAAAFQSKPKTSDQNGEAVEELPTTRITLCRPGTQNTARIVKPVQLQIPTNVIRSHTQPNMSSTTLEQLREFDMVYKQIKERSSNTSQADQASSNTQENTEQCSPQQRISFTYVNQTATASAPVLNVSSQSSTSSSSSATSAPVTTTTSSLPKIASKPSKGKSLKNAIPNNAAKAAPTLPKPQQKPQEDEHTTQRIFDILAEYAEQLRNSPDLNNKPAPRRRSNPPNNHSTHSKRKKSSSSSKKATSHTNNSIDIEADDLTMGSEDSSGGNVVQLSVTDDEQSQTTNISSTPPETSIETTSSTSRQQVILAEGSSNTQPSRNVILADSTVGEALKMPNTALIVPGSYIMPVSMVKGAQQIAVVSGGSKILATVPARSGQNMLLFQSFVNQNRKGAISALKYSAIQPITGISSQSIAGVSAQPPVILPSNSVATAVALGQPITLKKVDDAERSVNTELLLTISQPRDVSIKQEENSPEMAQPDSSTSLSSDSIEIKVEDVADSSSNEKIYTFQKGNSVATSVISSCIKEELEEAVVDNVMSANVSQTDIKAEEESSGSGERIQSVLVNSSASNGPMLSNTHTRYRKPSESVDTGNTTVKEEFVHNGEKTTGGESKIYKGNTVYYAIKTKRSHTSKKLESDFQKQAAIERELRLQKSLSEECEDLGVDEPSTSDLFPEADLLFDSNHSPSYDQTSQDIVKRAPHATTSAAPVAEMKVEAKTSMNLFSDDDENSSSLRTDLFDYVEYHTVENALNYQSQQIINGNNASNESASSCEDNTLLPNCSAMSEVTLNSPISPEIYSDNTQPTLNKYKYKYSNRKKGERLKTENWPTEVTSSEDTVVTSEPDKTLLPPRNPASKSETTCEQITLKEEVNHDSFKVVRVAISKSDTIKDEDKCQLHCEDNKRGSRRSTRKPCSCCNGSKSAGVSTSTTATKKRPVPQPQTPAPHKKTFFNKKR